ncbi:MULTISPECIES: MAB_1171c family putative transporter [unclassified Crossiella]|uniref:MAB_1171c family putative transporter n=1 Tax=unclassified Crossiella TaxID=2620835 RepID=UPI001FFF4379|nr:MULTISPECIES: MAB_1171c family putative transporter [unclassified Crossiella]MCK2245322.1 hypothetical protein [Crossiella sp. S99.2]MCK2258976.1 hypothetical protein [Crossiella sp. S99.1]
MISYVSAGLLVLISVGKLLASRGGPPSPGMRYLIGFFLSLAAGLIIAAEPTTPLIMAIEPFPLTGRLVSNACQMLAVHFLVRLARSTQTPEPRTRLWPLLLCWLAMTGLMLHLTRKLPEYIANGGTDLAFYPSVAGYQAVLVGYGVSCLVMFTRVIIRHARQCPPGTFRTGLRVIGLAGVTTVVWGLVAGLPSVWLVLFRTELAYFMPVVGWLGLAVALMWVVGAVLTTWQGVLERPRRWLAAYRGYRAVTPLWSVLVRALPGIVLASPPGWPVRIEFALYRRLIEIRDAFLTLRAQVPPEVPGWVRAAARRHGVAALPAVLAAAELAAALAVRETGQRWPQPAVDPATAAASIEAETAWLTEVSAAFADSPVVAEVRARAGATYVTTAEAA